MTLVRMALKSCPSPKIKTSNLPLGPFAHGPAATGDVDQTPGASLDEVEDTNSRDDLSELYYPHDI